MFRLFYSQNSPYARIARIGAIDCGLADRLEQVLVVNRSPDSPLLAFSPVCRVPTLVHDELVLGEACKIYAYFSWLSGRPVSVADEKDKGGWKRAALESMAQGFLEGIACWARERRRSSEQQSDFVIDIERKRAARCLDYFEAAISTPSDLEKNFAGTTLACSLAAIDLHHLWDGWPTHWPKLAAWHRMVEARPAMQATRPVS